jgi:hypothetical protein
MQRGSGKHVDIATFDDNEKPTRRIRGNTWNIMEIHIAVAACPDDLQQLPLLAEHLHIISLPVGHDDLPGFKNCPGPSPFDPMLLTKTPIPSNNCTR